VENRTLINICRELVEDGHIEQTHFQEALQTSRTSGVDFYDHLVNRDYIAEETLARMIAEKKKLPYVSLDKLNINPELIKLIPEKVIRMYTVLPIEKKRKEIVVAMANPFDLSIINDIKFASGLIVIPVVAEKKAIKSAIDNLFQQIKNSYGDILQVLKKEEQNVEILKAEKEEEGIETLQSAAQEAPIVKLTNFLITDAIRKKASDIHIEAYEDELRVRFRIDGVLHETMNISRQLHPGLSSRIKVMSQMDISERRKPQDGRIKVKLNNRTIDMRVNSIPAIFGEKIVIRVLDESNLVLDLTKLGFESQELKEFNQAIKSPHGMILVTGPTGSGKTTTLYSALDSLNNKEVNIMTAEDPVEYYLRGVNQVQMNERAGLNFASALRSFLRQDPDVILVGEIRDMETAEIAIKAAQTGHLVLSTLHTNDALSTIDRLINIGIAPFMVASAVVLIIAQRLIRKICPECKEQIAISPKKLQAMGFSSEEVEGITFYQGKGCESCGETGYRGRIGLYEVLPMKGDFKDLIITGAPAQKVRDSAANLGMKTIRENGIKKLRAGITTVEEILRIITKV